MKEFKRVAVLMILVFSLSSIAFAQDRYLMTGAARFEKTKDAHGACQERPDQLDQKRQEQVCEQPLPH
ncbi:hypothetical protein [Burkholderia ubonensis]|uniref:hypothetical protein n=1 Tax=Burkholderia ubonensis TaxID=101571 RepID=UPI0018DFD673|nr:hypothetical protein [Burkholderia ubonensis]